MRLRKAILDIKKVLSNNCIAYFSLFFGGLLSFFLCYMFNISKYFIFIFVFILYFIIKFIFDKIMPLNKKMLKTAFFSLILSLIIWGAFSDKILYSDSVITITPLSEKNEASLSDEVWLCDTSNGYFKQAKYDILPSTDWIVKNECIIYVGNSQTPISIYVNSNQIATFQFTKYPYSGMMSISANGEEKKYDLYSETFENLNVQIVPKIMENSLQKNVAGSLLFIFSIFIINFMFIELAKKNKSAKIFPLLLTLVTIGYITKINKYVFIIEMFFCIFMLFKSLKFFNKRKGQFTKFKAILFLIITLVNTFLFCGSDIFLNNLYIAFNLTLTSFSLYCLYFILVAILEFFIMYLFDSLSNIFKKEQSIIPRSKYWLYFILTFSILMIWALAFYPGNLSPDSTGQWHQAAINSISGGHPALMTIMLQWFYKIFKNPFSYIIFQNVYFSFTSSLILDYVHKKGFSHKALVLVAILIPLVPCIGMNNITLWKDIIYSISLLLLSFVTYRIIIDNKSFTSSIFNCILIIISLILVKIFRHNGIMPFAMAVLLYFFLGIKRKNKALILTTILSIIVSTVGINYLYNSYNVQNDSQLSGSVYNSIVKNLGATLFYNGNLSDEAYEKIKTIGDTNYFISNYHYNNIDYYFYGANGSIGKWFDTVNNYNPFEMLKIYFENIIKNPGIFIRDRFDSMDIMFNVTTPMMNYPIYAYEDGVAKGINDEAKTLENVIDFGELGQYKNQSRITQKVFRPYIENTLKDKYLSAIFWRSGLYFVLYMILMFYLILMKKTSNILALLPIIGNTLSWFIVLNHPSVRYVYYLNMSFIFLMLLVLVPRMKERSKKND